ncbi:hypothetical protein D7V97_34835 [Corallococcus sp. CA053C]|uniref:hypothetical protein n=1 Tax=Corallococcus sp. CA053C TaxID=2316732 RepID=UPI000EA30ABF|nr:hypothetical protein [Corallococcus sp. CA053C]RKG97039.1 hypothetical protein D7V97_34835 [Corallococcus sp. CA053C]
MASERHGRPVEALRNLTLSLQRLLASGVASGAVHGAADGLREELPELNGQLRTIAHDVLAVLARLTHEAAEREGAEPGAAAHTLAAAAMEGALEVLEREWQEGGLPIHDFMVRLNRLFDHAVDYARSRTDEIHTPGERARIIVRSMVTEASERLHEAVPALVEDARVMAPLGEEVASKVGRGLVEGIGSKLQEDSDALVGLLERGGRGLVRGLAEGLREELASNPVLSGEALGASLEKLAERTTAATLRGALEALGAGLRRPLMAVAGAGSALWILSVLAVRWRRSPS